MYRHQLSRPKLCPGKTRRRLRLGANRVLPDLADTGIDDLRWVFQAGWPGLGAPDGLLMLRTDVKASGESDAGLEKVVTVVAPGVLGRPNGLDRRIANTRDGRPVWIRPRRGCREGAPAARQPL